MILIAKSHYGRGGKGAALCDKKWHFSSFAENSRGVDHQDPDVSGPGSVGGPRSAERGAEVQIDPGPQGPRGLIAFSAHFACRK